MAQRKKIALVCASVALLMSANVAMACKNPNDQRDKWLAEWVDWIPQKGQTVELRGKTYTQDSAIAYAQSEMPKNYTKRGSDIRESSAGMSALYMIVSKNSERSAKKSFEKQGLGKWADASSCWKRFQ